MKVRQARPRRGLARLVAATVGVAALLGVALVRQQESAQPQGSADINQLRRQNAQLTAEVAQLREQLSATAKQGADTQASAASAPRGKYALEPFDVSRFLGQRGTMTGLLHKAHTCVPGWSHSIKDEALVQRVSDKMQAALVEQLQPLSANAAAAPDAATFATTPLLQALGVSDVDEPLFKVMHRSFMNILASFLLTPTGGRLCSCGKQIAGTTVTDVNEVGTSGCADGVAVPDNLASVCVGTGYGILLANTWSIAQIVRQMAKVGICTSLEYEPNFAEWWIKERLENPEYRNFMVDDQQEDTVLELFDMMYEHKKVFLKQKWMGVSMMQDPFDLLAIQNILFDLRPDLIVETGTANGGSALLWASILEIMDLHDTRIHTVDLTDPTVGFGSGAGTVDPTKNRLWAKYVQFHHGMSTDASVLAAIRAAASGAKTVLVLLDSNHSEDTVAQEVKAYCNGFVSVNSYCIVEDSKMSRMSEHPGPLEAIRAFLKANTGANGTQQWTADRDRELLYSQHVMGYLKRLA